MRGGPDRGRCDKSRVTVCPIRRSSDGFRAVPCGCCCDGDVLVVPFVSAHCWLSFFDCDGRDFAAAAGTGDGRSPCGAALGASSAPAGHRAGVHARRRLCPRWLLSSQYLCAAHASSRLQRSDLYTGMQTGHAGLWRTVCMRRRGVRSAFSAGAGALMQVEGTRLSHGA